MSTASATTYESAAIKRRIYLFGLPLGAITALSVWWLEREVGQLPAVDRYGLPPLALLMLGLWLCFWRRPLSFVRLELLLFASLSLFLSASMFSSLLLASPEEVAPAYASTGYWFPVLYGLAFLMFGGARGRALSLLLFAVSLGLGAVYVLLIRPGSEWEALLTLLQLYIANGLVLLLLGGFATLTQRQHEQGLALERSANTDSLTGLDNRRQLERKLREELDRAERYGKVFALLLCDLDRFKAINDRFGHDVGDEVLRELSRLLRFHVRQIDSFGRWGGEEFLIVAPELSLEEASSFATRLCYVVAQHDFDTVGRLTLSFGVSSYQPGDGVRSLYKRADEALYRAKRAGRNRAVVQDA